MVNFITPTATPAQVRETPSAQTSAEPRTVGSFSRGQLRNQPIPKSKSNAAFPLEIELAKAVQAFAKYRSIHDRDAVYIYLTSVFGIVMRWRLFSCAQKSSRAALRLQANPPPMKPEPFGIVIFCTADPDIVDAKTRSKWSRVLRYAARVKPAGQRLADFIKSNGGINECAHKFARITG